MILLSIACILAALVRKSIRRALKKQKRIRANLADLFVQLSSMAVWATGIVLAAVVVFPGLTPARALTVLGLGSIAVGFAFKDIFENFFAGVLILWRYPFDRGDVLRVDNVTGRVQNITIRNTFIERMHGELVVVPNATMFKSNVEVLTHLPFRRYHTQMRTGLKVPLHLAADVMEQALKACDTVIHDRPIEVPTPIHQVTMLEINAAASLPPAI